MLSDELCKQAYKGIHAPNGLTSDDRIPYILLRELYRQYKQHKIPEQVAKTFKGKIQSYYDLQQKEQLSLLYYIYPSVLDMLKSNYTPAYDDALALFMEIASIKVWAWSRHIHKAWLET